MGKALLLIHGFLTCTDDWDVFAPYFKDRYDEIITFKQPGHERPEEKPHYKDFTADNCYNDMDKSIAEIDEKFDSVDVIGHSMGGCMAMYVATKLKHINRLALFAPAVRFPRPGATARVSACASKLKQLSVDCQDSELAKKLIDASDEVRSNFKISWDIFFKRLFPNWTPRNIITLMRVCNRSLKYAKEITCPVAVFWGRLDEFVGVKACEWVINNIGSKEKALVKYGTVGHAMMYVGNIKPLVRDTMAFFDGKDLCDIQGDPCECRTVTEQTAGEENKVLIKSVSIMPVKQKRNVHLVKEHTQREEEWHKAEVGPLPLAED